jgi:hypothetical protein
MGQTVGKRPKDQTPEKIFQCLHRFPQKIQKEEIIFFTKKPLETAVFWWEKKRVENAVKNLLLDKIYIYMVSYLRICLAKNLDNLFWENEMNEREVDRTVTVIVVATFVLILLALSNNMFVIMVGSFVWIYLITNDWRDKDNDESK